MCWRRSPDPAPGGMNCPGSAQVSSLGFDVLAGVPAAEELALMLAKKRGPIKSVLLNQACSNYDAYLYGSTS